MAIGLLAALVGSGCRAGYLTRLAYEQARYLRAATPVTELLVTTQDPERRRLLEVLLEVREFADSHGLNVGGSYREVTDTSAVAPFHVVTAAYPDRLEAYTWWYPVVGAIPYRGYFDRRSADDFAAKLGREGLDVLIVQASAYSTLGWFDDPLPSSVLDRGETAVVVTVLHELVHQTFFAPGEIALNETLATAVSWRLAELYYQRAGDADRVSRVRAAREAWIGRSNVLDAAAERLSEFFAVAAAQKLSPSDLREQRGVLYAEILEEIVQVDADFASDLDGRGLNNAAFLSSHRYAKRAKQIDAWLTEEVDVPTALAKLRKTLADNEDPWSVIGAGESEVPTR